MSATRAANELRQAARFDEREQRANLTILVQRAYLQALFADRIAELQQRNLALAASRVVQVEQFQRAGQSARYDVLRARVERANIEPLAIQSQSDRELAVLELKRVLNLPVERPIALVSRIDAAAAAALLVSMDDSSFVAERAAIRSAELSLAARQLGIRAARADFFPTLTAFFQSGYQAFPPPRQGFPTTRGTLDNANCPVGASPTQRCQNGGFFSDRQAGLNVSVPIFDGFRVKSNVDLARAQARLAEIQLHQQREAVSIDVARSRAELRRARAVFAARQQNSAEAEEAFRLASLRLARGLSTQLEVAEARMRSYVARASVPWAVSSAS